MKVTNFDSSQSMHELRYRALLASLGTGDRISSTELRWLYARLADCDLYGGFQDLYDLSHDVKLFDFEIYELRSFMQQVPYRHNPPEFHESGARATDTAPMQALLASLYSHSSLPLELVHLASGGPDLVAVLADLVDSGSVVFPAELSRLKRVSEELQVGDRAGGYLLVLEHRCDEIKLGEIAELSRMSGVDLLKKKSSWRGTMDQADTFFAAPKLSSDDRGTLSGLLEAVTPHWWQVKANDQNLWKMLVLTSWNETDMPLTSAVAESVLLNATLLAESEAGVEELVDRCERLVGKREDGHDG